MRLKNNKCSEIDSIPGDVWKYGGAVLQNKFYEIVLKVWEEKRQSLEWYMGVIYPIHKKGKNVVTIEV